MINNDTSGQTDAAHVEHRALCQAWGDVMALQLTKHRHIGSWKSFNPTKDQMELELARSFKKLLQALDTKDSEKIKEKAADLCNFAMKAGEGIK